MKKLPRRSLLVLLLPFVVAAATSAASLTGTVRNGTTGAPAAGVDVVLIQLQGGMEAVADTKTDAQGRYHLDHDAIGRQPMLVRVSYRGVNFHQPVPPGRDTADVEVFEPTANARVAKVTSRLIVVQPNGAILLVGEEYSIENHSQPPAAYYKQDGNFEFEIPEAGELAQVSAWGPSGMPVVQGTIERGKRRYAVAFAFRPGESGVRLSYHIPYNANRAVLRVPSPYAADRVFIVAPPAMQIASPGFQSAGSQQGMSVYTRDAVPAGVALDISVSGTAPSPSANEQPDEVRGRDSGNAGATARVLPSRLDTLKWVLVGGFAALFLLGAVFLWRRPAPAAANGDAPVGVVTKSRHHVKASDAAETVDREVSQSLDELKDALFRLELRRLAGTVSEEAYARERARAEKILRDLVRG